MPAIPGVFSRRSRNGMGTTKESAKIKALILVFLTAIRTPLPYALFIPAGIVGLFQPRSE